MPRWLTPFRWVEAPKNGEISGLSDALAESINGLCRTELVDNRGPRRTVDDVDIATRERADWFSNHRRWIPSAVPRRRTSKWCTITNQNGRKWRLDANKRVSGFAGAVHMNCVSLMYLVPAASGARYQGRNGTFWKHHGESLVIWGYGALEMRCKKAQ